MTAIAPVDAAANRPQGRARRTILFITTAVVLPVLAAAILVWSVSGRSDALNRVPVAIVNNDQIITGDQPMAAGRSLAAALTDPKTSSTTDLDWTLTSSKDAKDGLQAGKYYSVLTIPKDFSKSVLSSGTDDPTKAKLQLVSNQASSTTAGVISSAVATTAATTLGQQITAGYLKNVYVGFNDEQQSLERAAGSAKQVSDGSAQLASGADQISTGSATLDQSLQELSDGAASLSTGVTSLAEGAGTVKSGATSVAAGTKSVSDGAAELGTSAGSIASGASTLADKSANLSSGAATLKDGSGAAAAGASSVSSALTTLVQSCRAAGAAPAFCQSLTTTATAATSVAQATAQVDSGAQSLEAGSSELADGSATLSSSATEFAAGASSLATSAGSLEHGAARVASGTASVVDSASTIDAGASRLASGAASAADASASLATGASSLASSATTLDSGAQSLTSGLQSGAAKAPTYSEEQQEELSDVVSDPVDLATSAQNGGDGLGWVTAAIVAFALWFGAIVGMLLWRRRPTDVGVSEPVSDWRLTVRRVLPRLGVALGQTVAVVAVVAIAGVEVTHPLTFGVLTLLGSFSFTLLAQAFANVFRRFGPLLFLLFLVVQLASVGNIVPLQTAPGILQWANAVMPLTAFINGVSQAATGGATTSFTSVAVILVLWGTGAVFAIVMATARRRTVGPFVITTVPRPRVSQLAWKSEA